MNLSKREGGTEMNRMINVGIDLGTTNSLLAVFQEGNVEVRKNSLTFKDTLPSAVWIRKSRIDVGEKARSAVKEGDPENVAMAFKRKMGTSERYKFVSTGRDLSPVELSAEVLKELRATHYDGADLEAAVITIPASFDTVQSNATMAAGELAGFKQVSLLQEPIAASLAYANKIKGDALEGRWLVYDLGGGTFDAALVEMKDRDLRVIDHEGDNYLGGTDFDALIVEKLVIPKLAAQFDLPGDIEAAFTSRSGKYHHLYRAAMYRAEEAKKELSTRTSAEIDGLTFPSVNGPRPVEPIAITRSEFEALVTPLVDRTVELVRKVMTRNNIAPRDLKFILLVGGSTFIPLVRKRVGELLGVKTNWDIDPVTAIAVGAAYYAASKPVSIGANPSAAAPSHGITVKAHYPPLSREREELFAAKVTGDTRGMTYRLRRTDGGYDTGTKPLTARITEDLLLEPDAYNVFEFTVANAKGERLDVGLTEVRIAQGKSVIQGQPLPEDICLLTDNVAEGRNDLTLVFRRGTILPARKSISLLSTRAVAKGSKTEVIHVSVYEGNHRESSHIARHIGTIRIDGSGLVSDLRKGAPLNVLIEMTEDRAVKATVELETIDKIFADTFKQLERNVPVDVLLNRSSTLIDDIGERLEECEAAENFELAAKLDEMRDKAEQLSLEASALPEDDARDKRYQLEDALRRLAQDVDATTRDTSIARLTAELETSLGEVEKLVTENGSDFDRSRFADAKRAAERATLERAARDLEAALEMVEGVRASVLWRTPDFLTAMFGHLTGDQSSRYNDQAQARLLVEGGKHAIQERDWDRLRDVNLSLLRLLPRNDADRHKYLTGITMADG